MPKPRLLQLIVAALALIGAFAIAACGNDDSGDEGDGGEAIETVSLDECTPDTLALHSEDGSLTVATDSPAFPPYFEDDDPTNGQGFESAVAYAIADRLGFSADQVEWVVEPFNSSYRPGPKDFDFDVNQISITEKRARAVDFSAPYYEADQALVALKGSQFAGGTALAEFAGAAIGVQIGTTSFDAVNELIRPILDPAVFDTSNDVVTALKQEQVDAIVVDVPTAFFLTAVQVPKGEIVGQFSAPGGDEWGALLAKDSELTPCVSAAIEDLRSSGELEEITKTWISDKANAPVLE